MVDRDENPHLSGPEEKAECYGCEDAIGEIPTVVSPGTPAGDVLDLPEGKLVEVCDECMSAITGEITGEGDGLPEPLRAKIDRGHADG